MAQPNTSRHLRLLSEGFFTIYFFYPPASSLSKFGSIRGKFSWMAFIFGIGLP